MNIEAKELSKIYGEGESRVVALDRASLTIAAEKVRSCTCCPDWIGLRPAA